GSIAKRTICPHRDRRHERPHACLDESQQPGKEGRSIAEALKECLERSPMLPMPAIDCCQLDHLSGTLAFAQAGDISCACGRHDLLIEADPVLGDFDTTD